MNKQIDEMAFDMSASLVYFNAEPKIINWLKTLENMHEKGYRKQDEVVGEIIQIARNGAEKYIGDITLNEGIRNMLSIMLDDFVAELKKKYGVIEE